MRGSFAPKQHAQCSFLSILWFESEGRTHARFADTVRAPQHAV